MELYDSISEENVGYDVKDVENYLRLKGYMEKKTEEEEVKYQVLISLL